MTEVTPPLMVSVCSLEHLREMKRRAGRPLDLLDLEQLDAAHPGA